MKKITLLLTILAFVLAFGSAYGMEMTGELNNGITVFAEGPVIYGSMLSNEAVSYAELDNGITVFAAGAVEVPTWETAAELSEGSAAGGLNVERELHNGITIFKE
jgi:ABC-type molybdate transport system substrate-binding protein